MAKSPSLILALCSALALALPCVQPAFAQSQPKASDQLKKANEGTKARNHVFDGTKAPPNAVRANAAPKPSPVGQPIRSTAGNLGYKPAAPRLHTTPPPSPVIQRSSSTTTSTSVSRSSTTVTSSTSTQKKK
jgi:hypothetical protein